MKKLLIILCCFAVACNKKEENLRLLDFYGKSISVPVYLTIDSVKTNSEDFCKNNLYLKNKEKNTFSSFELCSYLYNKRETFDKLNLFFIEECSLLEEEVVGLSWINKKSLDRTDFYEFTFEYKVDDKFYHVTYFAFEKYYLSIKVNGSNKNQIKQIIRSIDVIRNKDFVDDIVIPFNENKNCLSCQFPAFW